MMNKRDDAPLAPEAPLEERSDEEMTQEDYNMVTLRRLRELTEDLGHYSSEGAALMRRLPEILAEQGAARQNLVLNVIYAAFQAFDDEQSDAACFLLQIAVILTAGHENSAEKRLRRLLRTAKAGLKLPRD
jgi:hypothetical protein